MSTTEGRATHSHQCELGERMNGTAAAANLLLVGFTIESDIREDWAGLPY